LSLSSAQFDLRAYLLGAGAQGPSPVPGQWTVERDTLDRANGTRGTFSGVVRFVPDDDGGLAFREEGTMRWSTCCGPPGSPTPWTFSFPTGGPSTG
jgi:hypothetical protein